MRHKSKQTRKKSLIESCEEKIEREKKRRIYKIKYHDSHDSNRYEIVFFEGFNRNQEGSLS